MKLIKFFMALIIIMGLSMFSAEAPAATGADARGADILYQETDLGEGLWQYDYTFYNTSDIGISLYKVFLDFDKLVTVTGAPLPSDWVGTVWEGTNITYFLSTMSVNQDTYIDAGDSLGGFSFEVNDRVGDIGWYAEFSTGEGGVLSNLTDITAAAPPPVVPEPVSTILFITGGAVIAAMNRFRRKREIA